MQGIWSTHTEKIKDVKVLVEYDKFSNHHRPVVCYIPSSDGGPRSCVPKDLDIGALMEEAESFEQLEEIIVADTNVRQMQERTKQRKKKQKQTSKRSSNTRNPRNEMQE